MQLNGGEIGTEKEMDKWVTRDGEWTVRGEKQMDSERGGGCGSEWREVGGVNGWRG
jgi:hypothetical protein